jgi:hypothetical protein
VAVDTPVEAVAETPVPAEEAVDTLAVALVAAHNCQGKDSGEAVQEAHNLEPVALLAVPVEATDLVPVPLLLVHLVAEPEEAAVVAAGCKQVAAAYKVLDLCKGCTLLPFVFSYLVYGIISEWSTLLGSVLGS